MWSLPQKRQRHRLLHGSFPSATALDWETSCLHYTQAKGFSAIEEDGSKRCCQQKRPTASALQAYAWMDSDDEGAGSGSEGLQKIAEYRIPAKFLVSGCWGVFWSCTFRVSLKDGVCGKQLSSLSDKERQRPSWSNRVARSARRLV